MGDPGLLLSKFYPRTKPSNPKYEVGFILHYKHQNLADNNELNLIAGISNFRCRQIDVKTSDYKSFVNEILDCKTIVSTSLHGLIVADSYGIPNIWLQLRTFKLGEFKFKDYYSGIGFFKKPFHIYDLVELEDYRNNSSVISKEKLFNIQSKLLNSITTYFN